MMSADGTAQIGSIDYIIAQNANPDSIFYGKVDTENIGVAGHSQGGRSSVNAAVADDRIDCVLSIAGSNYKSEAKKLSTPTLFTTGSLDSIVMPAMWVKPAYQACTGTAVYASLKGGIHTSCVVNPDKYAGYAISWFDAFLKNDASAKKVFQPGGAFSKDSNWGKYASKNW
jgi:pimeloyl-ACP methyl ester carboxylesterase